MNPVTPGLFRRLPKADLHRHLEGSLRPATLWEFHSRQRLQMHASADALRAAYTVPPETAPGFRPFLACFAAARFQWGGEAELRRAVAECVEDAANDGVIHLELRFSPVYAARRISGVPDSDAPVSAAEVAHAAAQVAEAGAAAAKAHGIGIGFIVTMGRHFGWEANRSAAALLQAAVGGQLAGLDLAGDEAFPALAFRSAFQSWKAAGRGVTIHAGEDPEGLGSGNVLEALELGAVRIGHGVRTAEDPQTVDRVLRADAVLEMCPTSNLQTRAVASLPEHPLRKLSAAGVRVTINTDDPAISGTTLSREYFLAASRCGLNWRQLRQCALHAAEAVFLPEAARARLTERVRAAWDEAGPR